MYTETSEEIEIDLRRLLAALLRRAKRIGLVTILCAALALLASLLFITPQYQSAVTFYISGCDVDSGMVLLETGQTLDAVMLESGVAYTREELQKMLSAKAVRDTEFFRVTVTGEDAREAKRVADAVAEELPRRISDVIGEAVVRVADRAAVAGEPVSPNHTKNALIGALLGFAVMVGAVSLREIFAGGQPGRFSREMKRRRKPSHKR